MAKLTSNKKKILLVKLGALGDILMASPIITYGLSKGWEIDWLCGSSTRELVEEFDGLSKVISIDDVKLFKGSKWNQVFEIIKFRSRVSLKDYDEILLAHKDPRYKVLVWGSRYRQIKLFYNRNRSYEYLRFADQGEGSDLPELQYPKMKTGSWWGHNSKEILLSAGGATNLMRSDSLRRWAIENHVQVAKNLIAMGYEVKLIGGKTDEWVKPYFSGVPVQDLIGKTSIAGLLKVMQGARLLISHDSGPMHMAGVMGLPLVGIFGPTLPDWFFPITKNGIAVSAHPQPPCRPCYDGRDYANCKRPLCTERIGVADVLNAALELLEK